MKTIYLIKDLSQASGLSTYTIKYYIKFGLISEFGRSPGTNFRYFDENTLETLRLIREYRAQGKSLKKIKNLLTNNPRPMK